MRFYINFIHYCPLWIPFVLFFCISAIWFLIGKKTEKQVLWKRINIILLILSVLLIIWYTFLSRIGETVDTERFVLIPFQKETLSIPIVWTWKSALDNVLLFLPLGLSTAKLFEKKRYLILGTVISVLVEVAQYLFYLGVFETEDIICNTFGFLLPHFVFYLMKKLKRKA